MAISVFKSAERIVVIRLYLKENFTALLHLLFWASSLSPCNDVERMWLFLSQTLGTPSLSHSPVNLRQRNVERIVWRQYGTSQARSFIVWLLSCTVKRGELERRRIRSSLLARLESQRVEMCLFFYYCLRTDLQTLSHARRKDLGTNALSWQVDILHFLYWSTFYIFSCLRKWCKKKGGNKTPRNSNFCNHPEIQLRDIGIWFGGKNNSCSFWTPNLFMRRRTNTANKETL